MFKIKSDDQRQKIVKILEGFESQIQRIEKERGREKAELFTRANEHHMFELREQIRAYDELKTKGLEPFRPQHISEVGSYLVNARISSGITQMELATRLDVSQPMVHKYESVDYQGVSMEIVSRVAEILGVSLNMETFRLPGSINYNSKRQEAVILYFLQQINNKHMGKTKLMKLLYYADYEWIRKRGVSVTGDVYVANHYGPVAKHAKEVLNSLKERGIVRIEKARIGGYDQERYLVLQDPDLTMLATEEIAHLEQVGRRFESWTAKQMTELTHEDWPWQSTPLGGEIKLI